MTKILNRLPLVFLAVLAVAYVGSYFVSVDNGVVSQFFRLAVYVIYALASTVLVIGYVKLCNRSRDGKVALWLATATYAEMAFATTLWGVVIEVAVRILYTPQLDLTDVDERIGYALIGGGAAATVLAAIILVAGFKTNCLGYRIRPWPFRRRSRGEDE